MKISIVMFDVEHRQKNYMVHYRKFGDIWQIMVFDQETDNTLSTRNEEDCRPCMVNAMRELKAALNPKLKKPEKRLEVSLKHREHLGGLRIADHD